MYIPSQSWLIPRASVKESQIEGYGLFATESIKKGEKVAVVGGITLTDKEVDEMIKRGERYDGIALDTNLNLSIVPKDWPGIRGNHSCDPNMWMIDAVTYVARRDIRKGEEITSDYATNTISPNWKLQCNCGSTLCRKVVTGNDWQFPELQQRYKTHFAPVVQRLIDRSQDR